MEDVLKKANGKVALERGLIDDEGIPYEQVRDAIRNPDNFAKKIESSDVEISPGVRLASRTVELGEGNFTNMYDIYFNNVDPKLSAKIITRQKPQYQHQIFRNKNNEPRKTGQPIACINGAFFFLQHAPLENFPSEIIYNLNIRDGKVFGLPAVDRAGLFVTKDGHIHAAEIKSAGLIIIGKKQINWTGGEGIAHRKPGQTITQTDGSAVLFNSACCTIEYQDPADKTSLKLLRQDLNLTPRGDSITDIVVTVNEEGKPCVSAINDGGGTDFFSGNFILQMQSDDSKDIHVGDEVDPKTLDNLNLNEIESAMTTGPAVSHFLDNDDHEINHDPSLGTFPPFALGKRYARSVVYEDQNSNIHMVVFDAVPRSQHMKGMTPKEVAQNIPTDARWAVFLDGGQSSRMTFELNKKVDSRGNQQYLRLHRSNIKRGSTGQGVDDQFLWTTKGRALSSMIALYRNLQDL